MAAIEPVSLEELFDYAIDRTVDTKDMTVPDPVDWIEQNFIDPITGELVVLENYQKRIIRRALLMDKEGRSKYSLVVWSQPKKSGKTTVAAAVGCYVAENIEAPNEVSCVANDREQSAGRIFGAMLPTLERLGWSVPGTKKTERDQPYAYNNKSTVKAITTRYEKEAGGNQGLSLWSELWAYKGERLSRLWEEMLPPPTRKFSMRWVESYAGFIGESLLFQGMYERVFPQFYKADDFLMGKVQLNSGVVQIWKDLPVYEVDKRMLIYWDHFPRMPWQTSEYYATQKIEMSSRMNSYRRFHNNEWVDSADTFITEDMWRNSTQHQVDMPHSHSAIYALDASKNNDCTALVGTVRVGDYVKTLGVYIWEPVGYQEINFKEVEDRIVLLYKQGKLRPPLWYDPYQCVKLAQDLRNRGVPCMEFPQGQQRIKADTFLYKLYNEGRIINYPHPKLRAHVLSAGVREYQDQRIRVEKPDYGDDDSDQKEFTPKRKVDGVIAQSMSAYKSYQMRGGGWGESGI